MDEERVRKTYTVVEHYYKLHKADKDKPLLWSFVLAFKWLVHQLNVLERVKEENKKLKEQNAKLLTRLEELEWDELDYWDMD